MVKGTNVSFYENILRVYFSMEYKRGSSSDMWESIFSVFHIEYLTLPGIFCDAYNKASQVFI